MAYRRFEAECRSFERVENLGCITGAVGGWRLLHRGSVQQSAMSMAEGGGGSLDQEPAVAWVYFEEAIMDVATTSADL